MKETNMKNEMFYLGMLNVECDQAITMLLNASSTLNALENCNDQANLDKFKNCHTTIRHAIRTLNNVCENVSGVQNTLLSNK